MTFPDSAELVLAVTLVLAGAVVLRHVNRVRRDLSRSDAQVLRRSSLLNPDRVERINASRRTPGGALFDTLRAVALGVILVLAGVIIAVSALR